MFLCFSGVLCAVYASALLLPYGYLDDYSWFYCYHYHAQGVFKGLASQGRPLNEVLLGAAFRHIWSLGEMWKLRALTILGLAIMAWSFRHAMVRSGWKRGTSIFVVILCTTPAVQVYAAWATCVPIPVGGICAVVAALVAKNAAGDLRRRWPLGLLSAFLLVVAATIYQPAAMLFWPAIALEVFAPARDANFVRAARRLLGYGCIAGCGLFGAWLVFKWGVYEYPRVVHAGREGFATDYADKFHWFVTTPLVDSLNFPRLFPTVNYAIAMGVLLVPGLLAYFSGRLGRIGLLLLAAAMLPMSYVPSILSKPDWASYRTQIGLSWLILVYGWFAIHGYWRIFCRVFRRVAAMETLPLWLLGTGAAVCAGMAAFQSTTYIAWPQTVELAMLKTMLADSRVASAQRIIVIKPSYLDTPTEGWRYDEFGNLSLAHWTAETEIFLIRKETDPGGRDIPVEVRESDQPSGPVPAGSVLLDLRVIRYARR